MRKRILIWSMILAALLAAIAYSFRPQAIAVDLVTLERGPMMVSIDESGITRVRDVYVVSAPVSGRVLRIEAEIGDKVVAGRTVVAEIEPVDPALLDPRSLVQATADLNAAESALTLARAELAQAEAELEFARAELERGRSLRVDSNISARELDGIQRNFKIRQAALETAKAGVDVRSFEVERARAQLMSPEEGKIKRQLCKCVPIVAPVDGDILKVVHESEGVVAMGAPLVEIGDPLAMEIVVDLLSSDAVRVSPGQRVIIEEWGGDAPLEGRVRRVDVVGFTKVSALGIEEQRVNVVIDLESPRQVWARLGHGYQLDVRIVIWEGLDVINVPLTALFREADRWAVFVVEQDRAVQRNVKLGRRSGLGAEIADGLEAGEQVIVHPGDRVSAQVLVSSRD